MLSFFERARLKIGTFCTILVVDTKFEVIIQCLNAVLGVVTIIASSDKTNLSNEMVDLLEGSVCCFFR